MPKTFIDTNVLLYANDGRDPAKQQQAADLLSQRGQEGTCVFSAQVLHEYAAVALAKLEQDPVVVQEQVRTLAGAEVVPLTADLICRAVDIRVRHRISYWDACILAAAEQSGCTEICSEDLSAGHSYAGIRVTNPFAP